MITARRLVPFAAALMLFSACQTSVATPGPSSTSPLPLATPQFTCGSLVTLTDTTGLVGMCDTVYGSSSGQGSVVVTPVDVVAQWNGSMCTGDRRARLDREADAIVLTITEVYPPQPRSAPSCAGGTFPIMLTLDLVQALDAPLHAVFQGEELPVVQPTPLPTETATATAIPTQSTVRPSATPTIAPQDYPPTPVGYDPNATLPPPVVSTATPNQGLSNRERIDRYWSDVDDVSCVGMVAPQSLEELEARSDLVVVGKPTGAQEWDDAPYPSPNALIAVAVTDVLKRLPNSPAPPTSIQLYVDSIPSGTVADIEHLLFLSVVPRDDRVYFLSSGYMSIFANVGGRVVTPEYEAIRQSYGNSLFTTHLDGSSFDALVRQVRSGPHIDTVHGLVAAQRGYFAC